MRNYENFPVCFCLYIVFNCNKKVINILLLLSDVSKEEALIYILFVEGEEQGEAMRYHEIE